MWWYTVAGVGVATVLIDPDPLFPIRPPAEAKGSIQHADDTIDKETMEALWKAGLDQSLARKAFHDRSTLSLLRSLLVYELCSLPFMVTLTPKIMDWASRVPWLGWPIHLALRETAFRQFCGGETVEEALPLLQRMRQQRVSAILDLSIEADVGQHNKDDVLAVVNNEPDDYWRARREAMARRADQVMMMVEQGIRAAKAVPGTFFAIKCTALVSSPEILVRWTRALEQARQEFEEMVDGQTSQAPSVPTDAQCMDPEYWRQRLTERTIDETSFIALAWRYFMGGPPDDEGRRPVVDPFTVECRLRTLFNELDRQKRGCIDWTEYVQLFNADRLRSGMIHLLPDEVERLERGNLDTPASADEVTADHIYQRLYPDTQAEILDALERLDRLCRVASAESDQSHTVRLMADAEQSYLQLAIAYMARQMSSEHNRERPLIYDTYQLYLRQGIRNLVEDFVIAEQYGYRWAGKLVRGAYVTAERNYAQAYQRDCAIWPSKSDTDASFNRGMAFALNLAGQGMAHVVVATHNTQSVEQAVNVMETFVKQGALENEDVHERVCFAQLYGMGELIHARLGAIGYPSAKYVPYGPLREVIPYLARRAEENGAMLPSNKSKEDSTRTSPNDRQTDTNEDRRAVIRVLRERLGWRRWLGLREI
jgi:proline dehydrogenase